MSNEVIVQEILKLLPATDCKGLGGCGFSTCLGCAEAILASGQVNMCPACNQESCDAIAELLGVKSLPACDDVAYIHCQGFAAGKGRLSGCESCEAAVASGFAEDECHFGCVGIGSCIDCCTFDAMKLDGANVIIDKEKCTGCGACISSCPQMVIKMLPREATNFILCSNNDREDRTRALCGYGCVGCGDCQVACPEGAISMVYEDRIDSRHAVIDYDKCVGCTACTLACRKKIVKDELHDLTALKDKVAFVNCRGGEKASDIFKKLGVLSCSDAAAYDAAEIGICPSGCLGCGDCRYSCRYDAIEMVNGTAQVNPDKCVGCEDCMRKCPRNLISMVSYKGTKLVACAYDAPAADKKAVCDVCCVGCGDCVDNCPNDAIHMEGSFPVVDVDKCENCHVCEYMCAHNVIREYAVPEEIYIQRAALGMTGKEEK